MGDITRDSTAIEAREHFPESKPLKTRTAKRGTHSRAAQKQFAHKPIPKRKRGRPRKSEHTLSAACRANADKHSRKCRRSCRATATLVLRKTVKTIRNTGGYKLHIDVADGQIPISCLLTSASLHDSQAAIPLATLSAQRVTSLYDLMDAAYHVPRET